MLNQDWIKKTMKRSKRDYISANIYEFINKALMVPKLFGVFPFDQKFRLSYASLSATILTTICLTGATLLVLQVIAENDYTWTLMMHLDRVQVFLAYSCPLIGTLALISAKRRLYDIIGTLYQTGLKLEALGESMTYNLRSANIPTLSRCVFVSTKAAGVLAFNQLQFPFQISPFSLYVDLSFIISHFTLKPFRSTCEAINEQYIRMERLVEKHATSLDCRGVRTLEHLISIHTELFDACRSLNKIYSSILLSVVYTSGSVIIINFYFICYQAVIFAMDLSPHLPDLGASVTTTLLWLLELISIIQICVQLQRKSSFINKSFYKISCSETNSFLRKNRKVQVLCAFKPVVTFCVCGFIRIDYSLLHSVMAKATIYVVLLMQFGFDSMKDEKASLAL